MILVLLKITLLLAIPPAILPLMKRRSAALRHLVCAAALGGSLLLPLTLLARHVPAAFRITVTAASTKAMRGIPSWSASLMETAWVVWALVATVLLMRVGLGFWQMSRVVRNASELSPDVFEGAVSVPLACGLFHPRIVLPRGWPAALRHAAIRHERVHIERNDVWTNLLAHLACAAYWFHPLVWIVARKLHREQEAACDSAVIHAGFDPVSYAEALVAAARITTPTTLLTGCPMLTPTTLKFRIARILDSRASRTTSPSELLRVGLLLATMTIAIGLTQPVFAQGEPQHVGNGVTAPKVLLKIDPEYTTGAHDAKITGTVLLKIVVGPEGLAHDIQVVRGIGWGLDENAVKAVQAWRFIAGTKNGAPVPVIAQIEMNFRLLDEPK